MLIKRSCVFLLVSAFSLTACTFSQVPNSYATPNKPVATAAAGATAGAILTTGGLPLIGSGMAGALAGKQFSRSSLIHDLRNHGIIVIEQGDTLRIVLSSDRFFQKNGVMLKPKRYRILDSLASLLKEYGHTPIFILGYTDNVGSERAGKELTLLQARSLLTYLWVHGVAFEHLYAKGRGSANPVSSNDTAKGSAENRRIEIHLRDGCPNPSVC